MTPAPVLEARRIMRAAPERVFAAWTDPAQLREWWGPMGTSCPEASVDLRIGGAYRIANQLPDGSVVWATGHFEHIETPRELVYTWRFEPGPDMESRVTVRFEPHAQGTEVLVRHEGIADEATRTEHGRGWQGCLEGLASYLTR